MSSPMIRLMGFIILEGKITAVTGLHIGGTAESIDKGGIDGPVIKNPVTNEPYIPGSSLRGRMRSLLEIRNGKSLRAMTENIRLEHYDDIDQAKGSQVCRVFGNSASDPGLPSVLIVRDAMLSVDTNGKSPYMQDGLPLTEAKIEIVIDRITGQAMPRTIERVPAGAQFEFKIVYKVQTYENGLFKGDAKDDNNTKCNVKLREDLHNILWALETIEKHTGLGGNTARGHGQVEFTFTNFNAEKVDNDMIEQSFQKPPNFDYQTIEASINDLGFSMLAD